MKKYGTPLAAANKILIAKIKKKLKIASAFTTALGALATIAIIFMFLALSDIANHEPDQSLEWYITGVCMLVWLAFLISVFITMNYVYKYADCTPD